MKSNKLFLFILATGVFGILNTEMGMIGILPYMAEHFDVTISEAGLLVSLFALVVAVAGPTMPLLFSQINRRTMMLVVLGIFVVGNLVATWTSDFTVALLARVIPAFFHPVYCSLAFAAAAASTTPERAPDAVGKVMVGVAAGMVVGVPVSNWIAANVSLESALLFFAAVTALAFAATLLWVPSMPVTERLSYGAQLGVLRRKNVWMAILAVVFMNGAVFGVFSYLADYLATVAHIAAPSVSLLLFVYGAANVVGSYVSGRLLMWNAVRAIQAFPLVLSILYVLLYFAESVWLVGSLVLFWGLVGGINANMNQFWITRAAPDAPTFANGLFLTAANAGTMAGAMFGGAIIATYGMAAIMFGGIVFAIISLIFLLMPTSTSASVQTNCIFTGAESSVP